MRDDPSTPPERAVTAGGRVAPVPKRKKPGPYRVPPRARRHGLVLLNTGDDDDAASAAAFGLLFRAAGRGMRVGAVDFGTAASFDHERRALLALGVEFPTVPDAPAADFDSPNEASARAGWTRSRALLASGDYDILVLHGLTVPLERGWLDAAHVVDALRARPAGTHVVVTGRAAAPELIGAADLVTETRSLERKERAIASDGRAQGLLTVFTGDGKGKTTAALGMLARAIGSGRRVTMFQFIKSGEARYGEHGAAERLGIEITPLGDGFTWLSENIAEDRALAERGWSRVREAILRGAHDLIVLDELTYCLTFRWLDVADVLDALRSRRSSMDIVVTGRDAAPALVAAADRATEMHLVRHPYREQGIGAQPGIEL